MAGIAIDNDANKIYYAGNYTDRIYRANLDGSGEVSLISGINPLGIAIDGTTSKLFWCDSSSGKIFSSGLDGSSVKSIVTGLNEPTSIASYVSNTSPNEPENTPPVATAQSVSGDEDTSQSITLSGSDPDGDELTYSIASGPSNGSASLSGNTVTYTPNENYSGSDSFTFTVSDETITSAPATVSISVNPANDAPMLAGAETSALSFTEGVSATAITSALIVSDVDDTNIESATVQITGNLDNSEDVLAFTTQNGITGSFTSSTGLLTLSGSATLANYQTALRSVTYQNTDTDNPSTAQRTVTFKVNDGDSDSNTQTRTIDVIRVNDAPTLASAETSALSFTEGGSATAITSALTVSDADDTNIESATVQITSNLDSSEDVLAFTTQNGITGSFTSSTGLLTLSGSATLANYQTALRSVTYQNTDIINPIYCSAR